MAEDYKFTGSFSNLHDLLELFSFKVNRLIGKSMMKIQEESTKEEGIRLNQLEIWEKHLAYSLIPMVKAYVDRYVLSCYIEFLHDFENDSKEKEVFTKLALISLKNQIIDDYADFGGLINEEQLDDLKESCLQLNKEMKNDIHALTYLMPLNHHCIGVIAKDQDMYTAFMDSVKKTPDCFGPPEEWKYLYQDY